jgi:nucleoside-diphosphate-sugar epimerase
MAAAAGAPAPFAVPLWLLKLTMPFLAEVLSVRLALSTARARTELGWTPRFPTTRDGLADVVRRIEHGTTQAAGVRMQESVAR